MKKFFTIAIPTWEINGKGVEYLEHSFNILAQQTFKDFDVVISDHSLNYDIENLCNDWRSILDIKYYKNEFGRGKIAPNANNAITKSTGLYIKILFQDDFLYDINSLEILYNNINKNTNNYWFVASCVHTDDMVNTYDRMIPYYHDNIYAGNNTISCPTVLTIKNENPLLFDESLNWLVDVEYYKRLYDKYGLPVVISDVCVVNRNADVRTTNMISDLKKQEEINRVIKMYNYKNLKDVTIIAVAGTKTEETLKAIKYSCKEINFGAKKLITPDNIIDQEVEIIKCEPLNYEQYNHFIVYRLHEYIDTKFALIVQNDGYVVNPKNWKDEFLNYDYIGAPWPLPNDNFSFRDPYGNIQRVGNGGFSLRSKKILSLAKELNLEWKPYFGFYHEDGFFSCHNRRVYENHGCKFAPIEVAAKFSQEAYVPENEGILPFGFHGRNHPYYIQTQKKL